jgi:CheY-like chemotaxis protein
MEQKVDILVVDDQPANLTAMQALLEPLGQTLLMASSGEEALKLLLDHDVAVILLDVNMPGISGYETAQLIRERERSRYTPIIFLTARDGNPDEAVKGYRMGAVDFIFKPVEVDEIVRYKASVFVELHKARRRGQELESEQRRVRELQAELEQYRGMGAAPELSVGAAMYASAPLQKASKSVFDELAATYGRVLDQALESQALKVDCGVAEQLRQLAESLGFYRAGPRDVVELHTMVLSAKTKDAPTPKARALVSEGRFLVLELMGHLVSFYRKYYAGSKSALAELAQRSQASKGAVQGETP